MSNPTLHNYFFKPGNKFGKGRPPGSKSQLEVIRRRILRVVRRRVWHEKDLQSVSTTDLLKFLATIMPKDFVQFQAPQINYISNVPREDQPKEDNVDEGMLRPELPAPDQTRLDEEIQLPEGPISPGDVPQ